MRCGCLALFALGLATACGARSSLPDDYGPCGALTSSPEVLATGKPGLMFCPVAQDGQFAYWTPWGQHGLMRVDKRTADAQPVAPLKDTIPFEATARNLALDDQFVYWTEYPYSWVYRAAKFGGSAEVAVKGEWADIAVDDSSLFHIGGATPDFPVGWGGVYTTPKHGGPTQAIASGFSAFTPMDLTESGEWVYWRTCCAGPLARVKKTGGVPELVFNAEYVSAYAVDGDGIYVGASTKPYDSRNIFRVSLLDGTSEHLLTTTSKVRNLVADAQCLYFRDEEAIWRVEKNGRNPTRLADAASAGELVIDESDIVWTECELGRLVHMAVPW